MSFWEIVGKIAFAALILAGFWLAGSWLSGFANVGLTQTRVEPAFRVWLSRLLPVGVLGLGVIAALSALGVDTRGPLLLIAAGALALSLALREPFADALAGALIISSRPYVPGDRVEVAGVAGTVRGVALLGTTLERADGALVTVRSQLVWQGPLVVLRAPPPQPESPEGGDQG